ncbi:delta-1-pyrroline-5-carboxylate synthase-like protein [Dinothrombium tinctorium]|uniref:Delta-1-pyrroline-5-carboxylate synthase n=1 Tax=Dinothrombium tinctorium TaxID=1965070 RepID=A0A3S3P8N9_9ACAR|nr:delta-1-pyrroline-5-carboxylate synthase-like protein [Dinothrombium tinctorium]RWS14593.1 delta-1-pyrroline-5-carboxylate synthase-like protein [Dinothrombium tinctorium]
MTIFSLIVSKPIFSKSFGLVSGFTLRYVSSGKKGLRAIQANLDRQRNSENNHHGLVQKRAFDYRSDLKNARRIVVKLGSAVITREDATGIALGRLASIVEQVSQFQNEGKEMLIVTSGAVAFGKQKLSKEMRMAMSMRETLSIKDNSIKPSMPMPEPRSAAAVGQSGLMAFYDVMFAQYGVNIAQVLVTKPDFYNPVSRVNLRSTVSELLALNIVPIVNTNDAVVSPSMPDTIEVCSDDSDNDDHIMIHDNDSLAAHLAVEVNADLLILMSDVDGVYNLPPGQEGARLISTYSPKFNGNLQYGQKSKVGSGGMESKVNSAVWALERGVSVVICNGTEELAINKIMQGKKIGTFFTDIKHQSTSVETYAANARRASRELQSLSAAERSDILIRLSELLQTRKESILKANNKDLSFAEMTGLSPPLMSRLKLTPEKLNSLSDGLQQIAEESKTILNRCLRHTEIANGMRLKQVTVPIGVVLVIFESRPDSLVQIAGLCIATGNGVLLKGGKEANHTNQHLLNLVQEALNKYNVANSVSLVSNREEISELLTLDKYIDLVIPRGSNELVKTIKEQSKSIPVLGHADGICHVYVDEEAEIEKAVKIVKDSKCDYPAACNAMETLLLHKSLVQSDCFTRICNMLKENGVKIYSGPNLSKMLTFGPPAAKSMRIEYGALECAIEVVDDIREAIEHINTYGSSHTDVIVTENETKADLFFRAIDSACVFHNCSTRFADGYRFGLGAEVGISTSRIHARGPVGLEGLLTTKWILIGNGNTVEDFNKGLMEYKHEPLPIA